MAWSLSVLALGLALAAWRAGIQNSWRRSPFDRAHATGTADRRSRVLAGTWPGRTLPWLSPRGWLRTRRRFRFRSPARRLDAGTQAVQVAHAQQAWARWRQGGQPGRAALRQGPGAWQPTLRVAGWVIRTEGQRDSERSEPGGDHVPGRLLRSTARPSGLSPCTIQNGSTRRTRAASAPRLSAWRQPRRP
jgi:hypothetical protein